MEERYSEGDTRRWGPVMKCWGQRVAAIVGLMRQGRSNGKDRLTDRLAVEQKGSYRENHAFRQVGQAGRQMKTKDMQMQTWQLSRQVMLSPHLSSVMSACFPERQTLRNKIRFIIRQQLLQGMKKGVIVRRKRPWACYWIELKTLWDASHVM